MEGLAMRKVLVLVAAGLVSCWSGGCSLPPDSTNTPTTVTVSTPTYDAQEQSALDALKGTCNDIPSGQDVEATLDARAHKALEDIQEQVPLGSNETAVTVLHFVRASIPESLPQTPCTDFMAIYVRGRQTGAINAP
jgi:hypothetical protein